MPPKPAKACKRPINGKKALTTRKRASRIKPRSAKVRVPQAVAKRVNVAVVVDVAVVVVVVAAKVAPRMARTARKQPTAQLKTAQRKTAQHGKPTTTAATLRRRVNPHELKTKLRLLSPRLRRWSLLSLRQLA